MYGMWKRTIIAVFWISYCFLFFSCSPKGKYNEPDFRKESMGRLYILSESEDIGANFVGDLFLYKNYIVIPAYRMETDSFLHIYDKNTGKHLKSAVSRGRAYNELLSSQCLSELDEEKGEIVFYDLLKGTQLTCNIDELMSGSKNCIKAIQRGYDKFLTHCFSLGNNSLIVCNYPPASKDTVYQRFIITDWKNNLFNSSSYPYSESSFFRWNLYNSANCAISASKERFAVATTYGAVLETYNVVGGKLEQRSVNYFIEPLIGEGKNADYSNVIRGFADLFATDEALYGVYDGVVRSNGKINGDDLYHNIVKFSWDGTPLEKINAGVRIYRICYDEVTETLFAIIKHPQKGTVLAKQSM